MFIPEITKVRICINAKGILYLLSRTPITLKNILRIDTVKINTHNDIFKTLIYFT